MAASASPAPGAAPSRRHGPLARAWRRLWAAAPRRLRATPAGRGLLAITVGCGLLALSSGNNLLFLVWGLQLGTVLVSGVLSELSLRPLVLEATLPQRARVGERCYVALRLRHGGRRLPSYALQLAARATTGSARVWAHAPYVLRLEAAQTREAHAGFVPTRRGRLALARLVVRTGYPFGLFVKGRSFAPPQATGWVWPEAEAAPWLLQAVDAALGEAPAGRTGAGDDFFALRAWRAGDAPGRVLWRRAAGGRALQVRENELLRAEEVTLVLQLDAIRARELDNAVGERTLALAAGLAEALGARGMAVGLVTHGSYVPATHTTVASGLPVAALDALAALDWHEPLAPLPRTPRLGPSLQLVGLAAVAGGGWRQTVRLDGGGGSELRTPQAAVPPGPGARAGGPP